MAALTSSFILHRAKPKNLFVICFSIVILADCSLATFSYLKGNSEAAESSSYLDDFGWLPVVFVIIISRDQYYKPFCRNKSKNWTKF